MKGDDHLENSPEPVESRLVKLASTYYEDPSSFFRALDRDPLEATLRFRDDPAGFGKSRSYLGKIQLDRLHLLCLSAARDYLTRTQGAAAAKATYRQNSQKT